jgi:alpha-glucosidase
LMQELRKVVDEYDDRMLIGEDEHIAYHGSGDNELHLVFNFPLMRITLLTPSWIRSNQEVRLAALAKVSSHAWPCNTLGNHDLPRVFNRYGDGAHDFELARLSLALVLTLRGTPFLYYGEEIGMVDLYLEDITLFRDLIGVRCFQTNIELWNETPTEALTRAARFTRDKNRTPMQWSALPNAGFNPPGVNPWLPVNPNYASGVNVADQQSDPDSLLNFYRKMIAFRKRTPALIAGDYVPLHEDAEDYLAFLRRITDQTCLVILNMSSVEHTVSFDMPYKIARNIFSSVELPGELDSLSGIHVSPFEIYIAELT